MSRLLLDTSGLLALMDRRSPQHEDASDHYERATFRLTHNYVLAELVPLAQVRRVPREQNLAFSQRVLDDGEIETIGVTESLHRQALTLLHARRDKTYSLCDAVSFILMRERHIQEALTTDKHFEQEGFIRLLQP